MKKILLFIIVLFTTFIYSSEYPTYNNLYVNDYANLLSQQQEKNILDKLSSVRENQNIEITLLTIKSRKDYGNSGSIESFATGLFNNWGIGDANLNNGILILIAKNDRQMRIELGKGYSKKEDKVVKKIIDNYMMPYFKQSDFATGIEKGVNEVINHYAYKNNKVAGGNTQGYVMPYLSQSDSINGVGIDADIYNSSKNISFIESPLQYIKSIGLSVIAGISSGILLLIYAIRKYFRNKPRVCSRCQNNMYKLNETMDDTYLSGAEFIEESIKSVDYDVWQCGKCLKMTIERYSSWFSHYKACKKCNYKTLGSTTEIIRHSTTSMEGEKRIDYYCEYCHDKFSEHRTIPRESESNSSSSFGGGSSSGGGASGSW